MSARFGLEPTIRKRYKRFVELAQSLRSVLRLLGTSGWFLKGAFRNPNGESDGLTKLCVASVLSDQVPAGGIGVALISI